MAFGLATHRRFEGGRQRPGDVPERRGAPMNAKGERVRGWTDRVNVSALPFIAGVALTISGVLSFVLGLYTFNRWFGWCFIVLGVLLSVTGLALDRGADWAQVFAGFLAIASLAFTA